MIIHIFATTETFENLYKTTSRLLQQSAAAIPDPLDVGCLLSAACHSTALSNKETMNVHVGTSKMYESW